MTKGISRRFMMSSALAGLATSACAGAPSTSLRPQTRPGRTTTRNNAQARALIEQSGLTGMVGFAVADVRSGQILEAYDEVRGLPPASVAKAVTALYALDTLGGGHRFSTQLLATGPVEGGVVKGDLILAGGADPVLDTDDLAAMAARLEGSGVRAVEGRVRPWGGALPFVRAIDAGQPEHVGYNPAVSGLNLNFNRVHFGWSRSGSGYALAMDARSGRYRPAVSVARVSLADRRSPIYSYRDGGDHDSWSVARAALGNSGARWLPVRHPEAYAAEVFAKLASSRGVKASPGGEWNGAPKGRALVAHQSPPLTDVLREMLKYSTNLTAEAVGMSASAARGGRPRSLSASGKEMSRWASADLGMTDGRLVDHSGLGVTSRLSAGSMALAMVRAHEENGGAGQLQPLMKPFQMRNSGGGVDANHPVRVQAKTGTLYFVSALAGYATAPSGKDLAFAILTADEGRRRGLNPASGTRPEGSVTWNRRSKKLQQTLIERWARLYG
ncbi:MAG: D-alanyl-D-alanine carboxypeptidase [Pseudomonadota bacterium]